MGAGMSKVIQIILRGENDVVALTDAGQLYIGNFYLPNGIAGEHEWQWEPLPLPEGTKE